MRPDKGLDSFGVARENKELLLQVCMKASNGYHKEVLSTRNLLSC